MFLALINNVTVVAALCGWLLSQLLKLIVVLVREKRFDRGFLSRTGGMPSSHSATAAACAMSVGLRSGFDSPVFAVDFGILALVMIDAQSVRRAAGAQARLLNKLTEDFYRNPGAAPAKMVESLGHTRSEVLLGTILGFAVALLIHRIFPACAAHL
jgi:acid phosphatase family membrane protein YuiD